MFGLILCAGKGTRMEPLSNTIPKPLLPIEGKAILSHLITMVEDLPLTQLGIVTNEDNSQIFRRFIDNYYPHTEMDIFVQKQLTGIVTAILSAEEYHGHPILAMAGDTIFPKTSQVRKVISQINHGSDIVIGVQQRPIGEIPRRSNIIWEKKTGSVLSTIEKPDPDEIEGTYAGVPIWGFSEKCWRLLEKTQPGSSKEFVIEGTIKLAKEENYDIKAVEMTGTKDLTYPRDVLFSNFPYISHMVG